MITKKRLCALIVPAVVALLISPAGAESGDTMLRRGTREAGISTGFGWSFESNRNVNTVPLAFHCGYVFTDPAAAGVFRGCWEVLAEGTFNYLFHHQRKYGVGIAGLVRYNVLASRLVVPYLQAGVGVWHSNLDMEDFPEDFNFSPQAGIGLQFFLCPTSAVGVEFRVQHFSNAGLYENNAGLNINNIRVSFSHYF